MPGPGSRVHFISSKPAALFDQTNPDWIPTLKVGYDNLSNPDRARHRLVEQKKQARDVDAAWSLLELHDHQVKRVYRENSEVPGVACQTEDTEDKLQTEVERLQKDNQVLRSEIADMKFCGEKYNNIMPSKSIHIC